MATKYLDSNGVTYLWSKIKQYVGQIAGNLFAYKKVTAGNTSITAADGLEEVAFEGSGSATITLTNQAATQGTDAKAVVTVTTPTNLSNFTADINSQHFTQVEKDKLLDIDEGAEVNQNAFSAVNVNSTSIQARLASDYLIVEAGTGTNGGIALEGDDTTNTLTIKGKSEAAAGNGTTLSMVTTGEKYIWNNKQNELTFDNTPSANSSNPVTSGGILTYVSGQIDSLQQYVNSELDDKADKVENATANNLAALDANGNLIDSGVSATSAGTDTKNTAGSNIGNGKLYLVGARDQANYAETFTQTNAYITGGTVYSNAKEVVNLSDTQNLTNKTYNGITPSAASTGFTISGGTTSKTLTVNESYTLAAASAKGVDTSITAGSTSTNLPTTAAVESRITSAIATAQTGAAMYQGTAPSPFAPTNYKAGYYWIVGTAGTYASTTPCEPGDMIFAKADGTTYSASDFDEIQTNLDIAAMTTSDIDAAIAAA